jgi:hypothetical protein
VSCLATSTADYAVEGVSTAAKHLAYGTAKLCSKILRRGGGSLHYLHRQLPDASLLLTKEIADAHCCCAVHQCCH